MYTEKQAKQKWCPEVRMGNPNGGGHNTDFQTPNAEYYMCIASECIGWRWVFESIWGKNQDGTEEYYDRQTDKGYCGKYGRP